MEDQIIYYTGGVIVGAMWIFREVIPYLMKAANRGLGSSLRPKPPSENFVLLKDLQSELQKVNALLADSRDVIKDTPSAQRANKHALDELLTLSRKILKATTRLLEIHAHTEEESWMIRREIPNQLKELKKDVSAIKRRLERASIPSTD